MFYNFSMKNKRLLFSTISIVSLAPIVVIACSNNQNNDSSSVNETIVNQEIKRIEQLKNQLSLKIKNPTEADIKTLSPDNILSNLDNWTEGIIPDQPDAKFTYKVKEFTNGLTNKDLSKKTLSFKIAVKYQDVQKETSLIEIKYQIQSNPTKPPAPEIPGDQLLNPAGGTISNTNLKTSSYNNLITALNLLSDTTYLPELNDQKLTQTIKDRPELKDVSLTISEGSNTLNGILKLKLVIPTIKETIIEISGFKIYSATNNDLLQYHNFELDQKSWFDLKLPIENSTDVENKINAMNNEIWNKVLKDFQVASTVAENQIFAKASELKQRGFNFKITKSTYNSKLKQIKLIVETIFTNKKYQNNQWVNDKEIIWNQASNKDSIVKIFNQNQLQQFIVDQTQLDETELASYVPSYYLGKSYYYQSIGNGFSGDTSLFENSYLNDSEFTKYYFGQNANLAISFDPTSVSANDWANTLSFTIGLFLDGQTVNGSKRIEISDKNKSIETILEKQLDKNNVQILTSSSLKTQIIKHFKQHHKNEINQMFASPNTTQQFKDFNRNLSQTITQPMLNYENEQKTNQVWESTQKQIEVALFDQPGTQLVNDGLENNQTNSLNFTSHLFKLVTGNEFVIEQFQYQFPEENITINLSRADQDFITVNLVGQTIIEFAGGTDKIIPTNFFFQLLASEWNSGN